MTGRKRVAILISGRGSNMSALIASARSAEYPAEIALVISNRPDAGGLTSAKASGIKTEIVDHKLYQSREAFDAALGERLTAYGVELVACAGFMRMMTAGFVNAWRDRMINIHPSLLPAYRGLDTHRKALADGVKIHGCTVHFVRPELDAGPIVAQAAVPVLEDDTAETLAARVLAAEHKLYPHALALVAAGKAKVVDERVFIAGDRDLDNTLFAPPLP
jgi:phosphoribosylglycinamide formyltransferase 1